MLKLSKGVTNFERLREITKQAPTGHGSTLHTPHHKTFHSCALSYAYLISSHLLGLIFFSLELFLLSCLVLTFESLLGSIFLSLLHSDSSVDLLSICNGVCC